MIYEYLSKLIFAIAKSKIAELGNKVILYSYFSTVVGIIIPIAWLIILFKAPAWVTVVTALLLIPIAVIFLGVGIIIRKLTKTETFEKYIKFKK